MALSRLQKLNVLFHEFSDFNRDPLANCSVAPVEGDPLHWKASIKGPEGTPYEGGVFNLSIRFSFEYPSKPPQISFLTKIYHPNIDHNGQLRVDVLGTQWSPECNISYMLMSIDRLLREPISFIAIKFDTAMNYENDREGFNKEAREWTARYAMPGGPMTLRRLQKELSEFNSDPPANCSAAPFEGDLYNWKASIKGPEGTPYEGGVFNLSIRFPSDFPNKPPLIFFLTKIYHPNIQENGRVHVDILGSQWSPEYNVSYLLMSIGVLLNEPNPDGTFSQEMVRLYKNDREGYNQVARDWTKRYAMPGGSKTAFHRMRNDFSEFNRDPPANCSAAVVDGNVHKWKIDIKGPEGTPYEGGVFNLSIRFTFEYPSKPPAIIFLTQIYHTNVQRSTNYLSLDLLRRKWALGPGPNHISDLLKWAVGLLKDPIPDEVFAYSMAKKYRLDREGYNKEAREWTQRYAM